MPPLPAVHAVPESPAEHVRNALTILHMLELPASERPALDAACTRLAFAIAQLEAEPECPCLSGAPDQCAQHGQHEDRLTRAELVELVPVSPVEFAVEEHAATHVLTRCAVCATLDYRLDVTGCADCGEDRVAVARAQGVRPASLVPLHWSQRGGAVPFSRGFVPNRCCRECCPTGHGTRPARVGAR